MLRLENISVTNHSRTILSNVTATVPEGALTCLIGANGTGKTTLLRALLGELKLSAGAFYIGNTCVSALAPKQIARYISIIPQSVQPPHDLTVSELVALGSSAPSRLLRWRLSAPEQSFIRDCLDLCEAGQFSRRRVESLSGGEQRRVWLAFALAQKKRFLLLDETLDGLDILAKQSVFTLLKGLAHEGKGILLTTHDLDLVTRFSDRVIVLNKGIVSYEGPVVPNLQDILLPAGE